MLWELLLVASLSTDVADPVDAAVQRYRTVESYRVTLKSLGGHEPEIIRYYYKRPGFVRMEFIKPFEGAVLIYDPLKNEVRLWPFGSLKFPVFALSPENRLIRSATGQRVDRSDIGALLQNVKTLQGQGETQILGEEFVADRKTLHVAVSGMKDFAVDKVHRYDLWLESATLFPVQVIARDLKDQPVETVLLDDLQINAELPEELFHP